MVQQGRSRRASHSGEMLVQLTTAYCLRARAPPCLTPHPGTFFQRVTISNDGATIMKALDIVHPAAKTLVDISLSQDAEVGPHSQVD
jgi:hypothetical protein